VILELGGNDGLRALPIDQMRGNLAKMVDLSADSGAQVLLLGMRIPPNYGPEFTEKFFAVFAEVARDKKTAVVPFLLNDIALSPNLMQADGVHPNDLGQPKLLDNVGRGCIPCCANEQRRRRPALGPAARVTGSRTRRRRRDASNSPCGASISSKSVLALGRGARRIGVAAGRSRLSGRCGLRRSR